MVRTSVPDPADELGMKPFNRLSGRSASLYRLVFPAIQPQHAFNASIPVCLPATDFSRRESPFRIFDRIGANTLWNT
jgi:hypothetical protein